MATPLPVDWHFQTFMVGKSGGPLIITGPPTRKSGWAMARPSLPVPTRMGPKHCAPVNYSYLH